MILLDTDHISVLVFPDHSQNSALQSRLAVSGGQPIAATIIAVEEELRGWFGYINRHSDVRLQLPGYDRMASLMDFFRKWQIVRFDTAAAEIFISLRQQKVRIGSMDLKIAAITLSHRALLLSANLRDYRKVPGLRVENWLLP